MFGRKKATKLSNRPRSYQGSERPKQAVFSYRSATRASGNRPIDRGGSARSDSPPKISVFAKLQYALVAILVVFAIGYLTSLGSVGRIAVEGPEAVPRAEDAYSQAVSRQLSGSLLNKTKLTLNKDKVAAALKNEFPEVKTVEIDTSLFRRQPKVTIQLAKPTLRLVTPGDVYVLDEEGYALFNASEQSVDFDISELPPLHDNSGQEIRVGKPAVTSDQIKYIKELIGQFAHKKIGIKQMRLESGGLDLHVELEETNYFVKFTFLADARQSSGALAALQGEGISAAHYIDLRIPDRAYVK